ncbi:hypothetical protein PRZ48_012780 [Zasmidium cellare]|uniref:Nicotinamide-nucleotide adenylyltransferase n=1 Tax=Zasmidium cellare TaxID=395010 RepID=A0ABR0E6F1_ZASCE|nr:hypothetical protein PRZ48_012780 [Zasmidium cellare]
MAARIQTFRYLVPDLTASLKSFQQSSSKFRILKTLTYTSSQPKDPTPSKHDADSPKTLFILDSSFNPPSIAHKTLALSVLEQTYAKQFPSPHRLLLLFAVMNADKAPSPAAFEQRLAMMTVFARDLLDTFEEQYDSTDPKYIPVPIDIGVTKAPYYTDKSAAIEDEGREWYPDQPKHIHLVGFDTLTRFFNPKYYQQFNPPLSALEPYFGNGHRLRVTMRPDDEYGSVEDQKAFVKKLEDGSMESDGAKREWAKLVELVEPNPKAGVSSTKIRKAAKQGDWETVGSLCTPGVQEWVRREGLYEEDDRGAKMA